MMHITVRRKARLTLKLPFFLLKPVAYLWPLVSLCLPALVLYGLITYGSPMMWYEKSPYYCTYFDVIGFITVKNLSHTECPKYAFRKFHVPQILNSIGGH